jgi:hypothetical protein
MAAALGIPEIVCEILAQLGSSGHLATLAAAARVNRVWFRQALDLLWQRPPEHAFLCVDEVDDGDVSGEVYGISSTDVVARRQFYANKVRSLTANHNVALFRPLAFPQLREARVVEPWHYRRDFARSTAIAPLVRSPLLERLHTKFDAGVAALLAEVRPRLRELGVLGIEDDLDDSSEDDGDDGENDDGADVSPRAQRRVFTYIAEACPRTLESLTLRGFNDLLMSKLVVEFIATHDALAVVKVIDYTWRLTDLELVAERVSPQQQPFRALKSLDIELPASAVPLLVRLLNGAVLERIMLQLMVREVDSSDLGNSVSEHGSVSGDEAATAAGEDFPHGHSPAGHDDVETDADSSVSLGRGWDHIVGRALTSIAALLPCLRVLKLWFFGRTVLLKPHVLALRTLTNLHDLSICYAGFYRNTDVSSVAVDLDTDGFKELLGPLNRLRRLRLDVAADVNPKLLLIVGLSCPSLEELQLPYGDYDVDVLVDLDEEHTPLFRYLRKLEVLSFDAERHEPHSAM